MTTRAYASLPATIDLPDGRRLTQRKKLAEKLGMSDKTAERMNFPTVYIRMVPFVDEGACLQDLAGRAKRKNQPPKRRSA